MSRIFIATCTTRAFETQYVMSLAGTDMAGCYISVVEGQPADVGRNILIERFLQKKDYDYMLFVDSDATWHPDAIRRLASRELPFVSSIFFKRDIPPIPTIGIKAGQSINGSDTYDFGYTIRKIIIHTIKHNLDLKTDNELVLPETDEDLINIDGCGGHFILVRRDVLEKVKGPWFTHSTVSAGEDFDFCRKVQAAGFGMVADLSVYTGHIVGPGINFGLRQFLMFYHNTEEIKGGADALEV